MQEKFNYDNKNAWIKGEISDFVKTTKASGVKPMTVLNLAKSKIQDKIQSDAELCGAI